jgi:hypothetical protein
VASMGPRLGRQASVTCPVNRTGPRGFALLADMTQDHLGRLSQTGAACPLWLIEPAEPGVGPLTRVTGLPSLMHARVPRLTARSDSAGVIADPVKALAPDFLHRRYG